MSNRSFPDYTPILNPENAGVVMDYDLANYDKVYLTPIRKSVEELQTEASEISGAFYSTFTTRNDQPFSAISDGTSPIPYQLVTDPMANALCKGGGFKLLKDGDYTIAFCFQLTTLKSLEEIKTKFTFTLKDNKGSDVDVVSAVVEAEESTGLYKPLFYRFDNLSVSSALDISEFKLFCKAETVGEDGSLSVADDIVKSGTLDPYKNFVSIDPLASPTDSGLAIATTHRNTFAGVSFKEGYEIRTQEPRNGRKPVLKAERYHSGTTTITKEGVRNVQERHH